MFADLEATMFSMVVGDVEGRADVFASDDEAGMLLEKDPELIDHGVLIQTQSEIRIDGHRRRPLGSAQGDFLLMIFFKWLLQFI